MSKWRKLWRDPVGFLIDSRFKTLAKGGQRLEEKARSSYEAAGLHARDVPVGVIMTAYNTGPLVRRAAESLLDQSHQAIELWIIDDASTDETPNILSDLAQRDSRIKAFRSPKNHGTYWSKNWCLRQIKTAFVTFQDSDDISHPRRIRQQLGALHHHRKAVGCLARWHRVEESGRIMKIDGRHERLAAISLMMRRQSVLETVGYFDTVRISADTEYLSRIAQRLGSGSLINLREVLYQGLIRDDSLTRGPSSGFQWSGSDGHQSRELVGDRLAYHEAFKALHRGPRGGRHLGRVDFPQKDRPFPAPASMLKGCKDKDLEQVIRL